MIAKGIEEIEDYIKDTGVRIFYLKKELENQTEFLEKQFIKGQIHSLESYRSGLKTAIKILKELE